MDITVHHAELSTIGAHAYYVLTCEVTDNDGTVEHHVKILPADTFEWRAAEYDINPATATGWSDLLHLVLYEQHVDAGATPEQQLTDPDGLWLAPTVAAARKTRLARVKGHRGKGKLRGMPGDSTERAILDEATAVTNSGTDDPLAFIKATAPMSDEHRAVKREFVRRSRNQIRARRAGRDPVALGDLDAAVKQAAGDTAARMPDRESAAALAAQLLGPGGAPLGVDEIDNDGGTG